MSGCLDECVKLTVDDIEPTRLTVRDGKGGKDRCVPLPELMYQELRYYWRQHRNPRWIFPTAGRGLCPDARKRMGASAHPFGKGALQKAFHDAVLASGLRKKASIYTLRHAPARPGRKHPAVAAVSGPCRHRDHDPLHASNPVRGGQKLPAYQNLAPLTLGKLRKLFLQSEKCCPGHLDEGNALRADIQGLQFLANAAVQRRPNGARPSARTACWAPQIQLRSAALQEFSCRLLDVRGALG